MVLRKIGEWQLLFPDINHDVAEHKNLVYKGIPNIQLMFALSLMLLSSLSPTVVALYKI